MKYIVPKKLSDTNFAKYGYAIKLPDRKPDISDKQLDYWHGLFQVEDKQGYAFHFMRVKRCPIVCSKMMALHNSMEIYATLDNMNSVEIVAPRRKEDGFPNSDCAEAFILENGWGVAVAPGIWHMTPYALGEKSDILLGIMKNVIVKSGEIYEVNARIIDYYSLTEAISVRFDY
jgi:ureidoglycolate hydrolase